MTSTLNATRESELFYEFLEYEGEEGKIGEIDEQEFELNVGSGEDFPITIALPEYPAMKDFDQKMKKTRRFKKREKRNIKLNYKNFIKMINEIKKLRNAGCLLNVWKLTEDEAIDQDPVLDHDNENIGNKVKLRCIVEDQINDILRALQGGGFAEESTTDKQEADKIKYEEATSKDPCEKCEYTFLNNYFNNLKLKRRESTTFSVEPTRIFFPKTVAGQKYSLTLKLTNKGVKPRRFWVIPPFSQFLDVSWGAELDRSVLVPPGLFASIYVTFAPVDDVIMEDVMTIIVKGDGAIVVPLFSTLPCSPALEMMEWNCGCNYINDVPKVNVFELKNVGETARFWILYEHDFVNKNYYKFGNEEEGEFSCSSGPEEEEDSGESTSISCQSSKASFEDFGDDLTVDADSKQLVIIPTPKEAKKKRTLDYVLRKPFLISPACFKLETGQSIQIKIHFDPTEAKEYILKLAILCDNGEIRWKKVRGLGCEVCYKLCEEDYSEDNCTLPLDIRLCEFSNNDFYFEPSFMNLEQNVKERAVNTMKFFNLTSHPVLFNWINQSWPNMTIEFEPPSFFVCQNYHADVNIIVTARENGDFKVQLCGELILPFTYLTYNLGLYIKTVEAYLEIIPSSRLAFGYIPYKSTITKNITFFNSGTLPITWQIKMHDLSAADADDSFVPEKMLSKKRIRINPTHGIVEGGKRGCINISFRAKVIGSFRWTVEIILRENPTFKHEIEVTAIVERKSLFAESNTIELWNLKETNPPVAYVNLINPGSLNVPFTWGDVIGDQSSLYKITPEKPSGSVPPKSNVKCKIFIEKLSQTAYLEDVFLPCNVEGMKRPIIISIIGLLPSSDQMFGEDGEAE